MLGKAEKLQSVLVSTKLLKSGQLELFKHCDEIQTGALAQLIAQFETYLAEHRPTTAKQLSAFWLECFIPNLKLLDGDVYLYKNKSRSVELIHSYLGTDRLASQFEGDYDQIQGRCYDDRHILVLQAEASLRKATGNNVSNAMVYSLCIPLVPIASTDYQQSSAKKPDFSHFCHGVLRLYSRMEFTQDDFYSLVFLAHMLSSKISQLGMFEKWKEKFNVVQLEKGPESTSNPIPVDYAGLRGLSSEGLIRKIIQLQEELDQTEKQVTALKETKSLFLRNLSHEMNTPLHSILSAAEMLLSSALVAEDTYYVEIIRERSLFLNYLLTELLDLGKLDAGQVELDLREVRIQNLLREACAPFARQATIKGLTFNFNFDEQLPEKLLLDGPRVQQVLRHIVSNAVKFTEVGGVEVSVFACKNNAGRAVVKIEVADTGIGIEENKMHEVFGAFFQADSRESRRYEGAGFGLNIAQKVVSLMKGGIHVCDNIPAGCKFTVELPLESKSVEPASRTEKIKGCQTRNSELNNLKVLFVEDNNLNQKLGERILKNLGCSDISLASDGKQAHEIMRRKHFDLVFMDIQMPVMDGINSVKHARLDFNRLPSPWIVALTANTFSHYRKQCFAVGMNNFLAKPVRTQLIEDAMSEAIWVKEQLLIEEGPSKDLESIWSLSQEIGFSSNLALKANANNVFFALEELISSQCHEEYLTALSKFYDRITPHGFDTTGFINQLANLQRLYQDRNKKDFDLYSRLFLFAFRGVISEVKVDLKTKVSSFK